MKGSLSLDPPGDHRVDVTTNPTPARVDTQSLTQVSRASQAILGTYVVTSPSINQTSTIPPASSTYTVGSFVTDISIQPYMDGNVVKFTAYGLRPNTIVYPFFDNVYVGRVCQSADSTFQTLGNIGGSITTDSDGSAYGVFYLPAGTFLTGDRVFKLVDVSNLATEINAITTEASAIYHASNINITKQQVEGITRPPVIIDPTPPTPTPPTPTPQPPLPPITEPPPNNPGTGTDAGGGNSDGGYDPAPDAPDASESDTGEGDDGSDSDGE